MFYFVSVVVLLLAAPLVSMGVEAIASTASPDLWGLAVKWFTFWAIGVRLFVSGLMQVTRPQFTAISIFKIADPAAHPIVREVGFGNLAIGTLGLASLMQPLWLTPAAFIGALFYGLAGAGHVLNGERNAKEQFALVTDLAICALLALCLIARL